jgi:hypothetical protein
MGSFHSDSGSSISTECCSISTTTSCSKGCSATSRDTVRAYLNRRRSVNCVKIATCAGRTTGDGSDGAWPSCSGRGADPHDALAQPSGGFQVQLGLLGVGLYYPSTRPRGEPSSSPTVADPGYATAIACSWAGLNTVGCDEGRRLRVTLGFVPQHSAALSGVIAHRRAGRPRW